MLSIHTYPRKHEGDNRVKKEFTRLIENETNTNIANKCHHRRIFRISIVDAFWPDVVSTTSLSSRIERYDVSMSLVYPYKAMNAMVNGLVDRW